MMVLANADNVNPGLKLFQMQYVSQKDLTKVGMKVDFK